MISVSFQYIKVGVSTYFHFVFVFYGHYYMVIYKLKQQSDFEINFLFQLIRPARPLYQSLTGDWFKMVNPESTMFHTVCKSSGGPLFLPIIAYSPFLQALLLLLTSEPLCPTIISSLVASLESQNCHRRQLLLSMVHQQ